MAWCELHEQVLDDLKIHRLATSLGIEYAHALGLLCCLWAYATSHARDGDLTELSPAEIAHACRFEGDANMLFNALKKCRLLDEDGTIHNWKKRGVKYLENERKKQGRYRRQGWRDPLGWSAIRVDILRRDNFTCQYCGKKATTIDHLIPVSRKGTHEYDNLVAACKSCNFKKHDKTIEESGITLEYRERTKSVPPEYHSTQPNHTIPSTNKDIKDGSAAAVRLFMAKFTQCLKHKTGQKADPKVIRKAYGRIVGYLKTFPGEEEALIAELDRTPEGMPQAWYVAFLGGQLSQRMHERLTQEVQRAVKDTRIVPVAGAASP